MGPKQENVAVAWYEHPTVAAVMGGIAGAILTALFAAVLARLTRKVRRVDCVVTDVASLLTFSERIRDELKVTYSGKSAQSVYLMSLDIISTGTEAVNHQPVNIRLTEGARIVDYSYSTDPPIGFGEVKEIKRGEHELDLQIELLNPGDKVAIELLTLDNPDETINVYLKNANVQTRTYSRALAERTILDLMNNSHVMWLAVLGALPLIGEVARSLIDVAVAKKMDKLAEQRTLPSNRRLRRPADDTER